MDSSSFVLGLLIGMMACGGGAPGTHIESSGPAPTWEEAANATYPGIEESPVTLLDGGWDGEPFDPDGFARPHVELAEGFWLAGDLQGGGTRTAVVLLSAASGGSGTDVYLAALARDGAVIDARTALVGNRVQVRDARIEGRRVVLDVVQAGPTDAMCCPGEKATRAFAFEGEAFVEVDSRVTGRLAAGDLSGVDWRLVKLGDLPAPDALALTFALDGTRVGGEAGCNRYVGELGVGAGPGELEITLVGSSRKECPEAVMALEGRYLAALERVRRFGFVAGRLVLTPPDGVDALWFRPGAPAP